MRPKFISFRQAAPNLQPPMTGIIKYAGWLDPSGKPYPVSGDSHVTHAEWMLEHYDWLVTKGWRLPSKIEMRSLVNKSQVANVRNILVKQGWIAIQSPSLWHIRDMRSQAQTIQDAIMSREVNVTDRDWPIEVFIVDTGDFVRIDRDELEDDLSTKQIQVLAYIRKKHGFTKEALRNMSEYLVTFKHILKIENGQSHDYIIADSYGLVGDKDLQMKFNVAFMEAGMNMEDHGYYRKQLSQDNPNGDYQETVAKIDQSIKQMVDPKVQVIAEKEYGRDDRSVIYVQIPKPYDFK